MADFVYSVMGTKYDDQGDDFTDKQWKKITSFYEDKFDELFKIQEKYFDIAIPEEVLFGSDYFGYKFNSDHVFPFWDYIEVEFKLNSKKYKDVNYNTINYSMIQMLSLKPSARKNFIKNEKENDKESKAYIVMEQFVEFIEQLKRAGFYVRQGTTYGSINFRIQTRDETVLPSSDTLYGKQLLEYNVGKDLVVNLIKDSEDSDFTKVWDEISREIGGLEQYEVTRKIEMIAGWEPGDPIYTNYETEMRDVVIPNLYRLSFQDCKNISDDVDFNWKEDGSETETTRELNYYEGYYDDTEILSWSQENLVSIIYILAYNHFKKDRGVYVEYLSRKNGDQSFVLYDFDLFKKKYGEQWKAMGREFTPDDLDDILDQIDNNIEGSVAWLETQLGGTGDYYESKTPIEQSNILLESAIKDSEVE